jgi:hypothetical protein
MFYLQITPAEVSAAANGLKNSDVALANGLKFEGEKLAFFYQQFMELIFSIQVLCAASRSGADNRQKGGQRVLHLQNGQRSDNRYYQMEIA